MGTALPRSDKWQAIWQNRDTSHLIEEFIGLTKSLLPSLSACSTTAAARTERVEAITLGKEWEREQDEDRYFAYTAGAAPESPEIINDDWSWD